MWYMKDVKVVLLDDGEAARLCRFPYPNHPKGCPNFGKKCLCPPKAPRLNEAFRMDHPLHLVWARFDIGTHARNLKMKHPDWTDRQCYCCLYWQGKVNVQLRNLSQQFLSEWESDCPGYVVNPCAEAMGVDFTETMKWNCGIELEWPPLETVYKIALIGMPTDEWRDRL